MSSGPRWLIPLGLVQVLIGAPHLHAATETVTRIEIRGTINPASAAYLRGAIAEAKARDAQALIVELDTPGGLVSSVEDMAQAIGESEVPVVVHTMPAGAAATSAGALLSLAAHVAAMAPGTHIGAAHPVNSDGKDIEGTMKEKATNDTAAFARSLAELRGRPRELAEAIVLKSRSLTAQEAHAQGLIEILAPTREALLKALDGREVKLSASRTVKLSTGRVEAFDLAMTAGQRLLHTLANPNIATLLMSLGLLLIYFELSAPGVGFPGVLGVIFLLVAFMSFQLLPIRAGGLALIGLGFAMLIAEMFVTSHGALALGGTLAFVLGVLWVMDPSQTSLQVSTQVWAPLAVLMGGGALGVAWFASRSREASRRARARIGGSGPAGLEGYRGRVESIGPDGRSGKLTIRGETWDFECARAVSVGDSVEIAEMRGMKVVVR